MAALFMNFLCMVVILSLVGQGICQCTKDNLIISQVATGINVVSKPEWNVTISNNCACSQSDLSLACDGFRSVRKIDPKVVDKVGGACLINDGQPVFGFSTFNFSYAWDTVFPFKIFSTNICCS